MDDHSRFGNKFPYYSLGRWPDDTREYNHKSSSSHLQNGDVSYDVTQRFCMKAWSDSSGGYGEWPSGNYCIYTTEFCPIGFQCGWISWDDEDIHNINKHGGSKPYGSYEKNTNIWYACRDDGNSDTEIILPATKPFYLFRYTSACQKVSDVDGSFTILHL